MISQATRELAAQLGVLVIYQFGSQVRGVARPDSDYDVAILLASTHVDLEVLAGHLCSDLQISRHQLDLKILNDAAPAFQYQVVRDRTVLYEVSRDLRAQYETFVVKEYLDDDYFRGIHRQARRERLKAGRFGHRPTIH